MPRHSGGWSVLRERLETESGLQAMDVGYTSPANVHYLTGRGHSVFLADVVHDAWTGNWQSGFDFTAYRFGTSKAFWTLSQLRRPEV